MKSQYIVLGLFVIISAGSCSEKNGGKSSQQVCPTPKAGTEMNLPLALRDAHLQLADDKCRESLVDSTTREESLQTPAAEGKGDERKPAATVSVPSAGLPSPASVPNLGEFAIVQPVATSDDPNQILTFTPSQNASLYSAELCGAMACEVFTLDPSLHQNGKYLPTLQNGEYSLKLTALGALGQSQQASNTNLKFTVNLNASTSGTWEPFDPAGEVSPRSDALVFWSEAHGKMVVWGGSDAREALNSGALFDPTTKVWTAITKTSAPAGRVTSGAYADSLDLGTSGDTTGALFVWGGSDYHNAAGGTITKIYADGGIYDLASDTWSNVNPTGAPAARWRHSTVWAPQVSKFLLWGGVTAPLVTGMADFSHQGFIYDPAGGGTWTAITPTGAPQARAFHAAVWTGSKMIVWGGLGPVNGAVKTLNSGALYDPVTNTWTPMATQGAPSPRYGFASAWVSGHFIVWSGVDSNMLSDGFKYNPVTDTWTKISGISAPAPNFGTNTAVATTDGGSGRIIIWGGINALDSFFYNTGAIYDVATDTWKKMALPLAPKGRYGHGAVWNSASNKLIIFGGDNIVGPQGANSSILGDGGIYTPAAP